MKLNCGLTAAERHAARGEWHRWFAWRPVRVASRDCRWLEGVERRRRWVRGLFEFYTEWEYRALDKRSSCLLALGMFLAEHFSEYRS